jgi:cytochrome c2
VKKMTEHKFTDEEIIKAFKCCSNADIITECGACPYYKKGCLDKVHADAADLINRQKAEVSYWQDEAANAKREAVKEFADRLKKYYASLNGKTAAGCVEYHIDQILKEMIGETK